MMPTKTFEFRGQEVQMYALNDSRAKKPAGSEYEVLKQAMGLMDEDDVFWDIGANTGSYTVYCGAVAGEVHAFEPSPTNFQRLGENIELNGYDHVHAHNMALSDESGEIRFDIGDDHIGRGQSHIDPDGDHRVRAVRGEETDFTPPTMMKIDVEGAELKVLRGMEPYLDNIDLFYIEIHDDIMEDRYGYSKFDVIGFLRRHGFSINTVTKDRDNMYRAER